MEEKVNSPRFFTGYQVASDLLSSAKAWPVAKDYPVAVGFVEAGIQALASFDVNNELVTEPIVDAIVSGLRLATAEPETIRRVLDSALDQIAWAGSQSQA